MKVSVIIPVKNSEKYLNKCAESLMNQTLGDIEFIFIDNNSSDKSYDILRSLKKKDSRIKIIRNNLNGVSGSRNAGLKIANGEYIGFVDSDDYIDKNMFKFMVDSAEKNNSDLVICNIERIFDNNKIVYDRFLPEDADISDLEGKVKIDFLENQKNGYACNKLYRRKIINENNIVFDETSSIREDLLFNLYYLDYVKSVSYVDKYLYYYINRKGSGINRINRNGFNTIKKIYKKTIDNYKKWNFDSSIEDAIDRRFSVFSYMYAKECMIDYDLDLKKRKQNLKSIVKDSLTQKFRFKLKSKKYTLCLRYRIFYRILNIESILVIYIFILNIISCLKGNYKYAEDSSR